MNVKRKASTFRHTGAFWVFVVPCLLLYGTFFLLPLVLNIGLSFTNYDGWKVMNFVGAKNYISLVRDAKFFQALGRTFLYALFSLPFKVIVPLLIALLVTSSRVRAKGVFRTMFYIPVLLSSLVVGVTINWMFSQEYGLVNFLIQSLGGTPLEWALNPYLATFVVSFASNWASTGFYMIIFIGGINNISKELFEASSIDGANGVQNFFFVTLPLLRPTTFLVLLLATVGLLKEYALVQGITQGGPGLNTTYIIQYIFDRGFTQMEYGYASSMSCLAMIIFGLIAFVQFKINQGGEEA